MKYRIPRAEYIAVSIVGEGVVTWARTPVDTPLPFVPEPTLTWALGVHIGRACRGPQGLPRHARRPQRTSMPRCPRFDRRPAMISENVRVFVILPHRGRCYDPLPIFLWCPCVFRGFSRRLQTICHTVHALLILGRSFTVTRSPFLSDCINSPLVNSGHALCPDLMFEYIFLNLAHLDSNTIPLSVSLTMTALVLSDADPHAA